MDVRLEERFIDEPERARQALVHIDSLICHLVLQRLTTGDERAPAEISPPAPAESVEQHKVP